VDFLRAQREFLADFQVLAAAAGAADLPPAPLQGSLDSAPPFDAEKQATAIEEQSPEIRRARQRVAVAQARLKDAQRESFPDLTLRGGEWWSGELTGSSNRAAGPMSFLEAGVKLPLWNRNQGNVEAAKAELEQARQEVLRVQLALRQRTEPLAQRYLAARFESERYRTELLPRARRAYELYLMKYQQMAGSYPQVLLSQRTLFELQIDYIRSLAELWSNAVALQNYGLTDGLQPPAGAPEEPGALNLPNGGGGD
jgi:cobalt-zinc-cadmium efflux system outer membrane protein